MTRVPGISVSHEREWVVDIDALRKAFPNETAGLTDKQAARDAWDNGVREPYFEVEHEIEDWHG